VSAIRTDSSCGELVASKAFGENEFPHGEAKYAGRRSTGKHGETLEGNRRNTLDGVRLGLHRRETLVHTSTATAAMNPLHFGW
jgi:hypothetical protein